MHNRLVRRSAQGMTSMILATSVALGGCGTAGEFDFFGNPAGPDQLVNSEFQSFNIEKMIQLIDPLGKRSMKGEMLMEAVLTTAAAGEGAKETFLQSKVIAVLGDKRTAFLNAREHRDTLREQLEQLRSQRDGAEETLAVKRKELVAAKTAYDRETARIGGADYLAQIKKLESNIAEANSKIVGINRTINDNNEVIAWAEEEISKRTERPGEKRLDTGPSTAPAVSPSPELKERTKPFTGKKAQAEEANRELESIKADWQKFKENAETEVVELRKAFKAKADSDEAYKAKVEAMENANKALEKAKEALVVFEDDPKNNVLGSVGRKENQLQKAEQAVSQTAAAFNTAYDAQVSAFSKKSGTQSANGAFAVANEFHLALLAADQYADASFHRNRVQERLMAASQQACNFYKDRLRRLDTSVNFFLGSLTTVLGGVSPLFSGSSDVLGALAGVTSGVRSEFNTTYFQNLSLHVITRGIDSRRERRLTTIRAKNSSAISDYNTTAAVVDALKFHNDCSLNAGLEEASDALQLANNFRNGNVGVSEATKTLKDLKDLNEQVRELRGEGPLANSVKDVDRIKAEVAILSEKVDAALAELKAGGMSEESLMDITDTFTSAKETATTAFSDLSRRAAESSVKIAKAEGDIQRAPLDGQSALREAKRLLVRVDNGISSEAEQAGKVFTQAIEKLDGLIAAKRTEVRETVATAVAGLGDDAIQTLLLQLKPMFPALKDTGDVATAKNDIAGLAKNDATAFSKVITMKGLVTALAEKEITPVPVTEVEEKELPPDNLTKAEAEVIMEAFRTRVPGIKDVAGLDVDLSKDDWAEAMKPYVEEIQIALPGIQGNAIDGLFGKSTRAQTNPNAPDEGPKLLDEKSMVAVFGSSPSIATGLSKLEAALEKPGAGTDTHNADRTALRAILMVGAFDKLSDAGVRDAIKAHRASLSMPPSDHLSALFIRLLFSKQPTVVPCTTICDVL